MWTSTLDLDPKRVLVTQLLGRIWRGAYFSSFAPLQVENLPRQPLPTTTWVRVRNRLAGICGSDLHMIQVDGDLRIAPAAIPSQRRSYPGHEVVGEVLEIGADVRHLRVGDRVVLQYGSNCLTSGLQPLCRSCAQGHYNLCERGKLPGPAPMGGGWSEEMLLHEQQLFRVPADISDDQAVLLEPASVAVHAVLRSLPKQGDRVLIIGAGTIGLLTLQVVRALAPQVEVSVLARHPFQIEQATRLGAAHIIYPQDSYTGIQRATDAHLYESALGNRMLLGGYDVIYDTVGSEKTLHHALRWARARSSIVLVGLNLHLMHIDLTPIWYQEINLLGSLSTGIEIWPLASNEQRSTFEVTAELIKRRQIHPEHLITHRFPLTNYQVALMTAAQKSQSRAIKVVFDYSLLPASVVPNVRASAARLRRPASTIQLDDQSVPEKDAYPVEALASSISVKPPEATSTPSLSSKVTTIPDDDVDAMEDTAKAPAIIRQKDTKTSLQLSSKIEDIATLPIDQIGTTDAVLPASDTGEPVIETLAIVQYAQQLEKPTDQPATEEVSDLLSVSTPDETLDEPAQNLQPASEPQIEAIQDTIDAEDLTPTDEPESAEPLAIPVHETVQDSSSEYFILPAGAQDIPEPSEVYILDLEEQIAPEPFEQQLPEIFEEAEAADMEIQSSYEDMEAFPTLQYEPIDFVPEQENGDVFATNDTENALLPVEGPQVTPLQPHSRTRMRKKNKRTAQRGG